MKLTSYEKMYLRETQCDYLLSYWAARAIGLNRHRARRSGVTSVFAFAAARRVKFLMAHHKLWATHTIRASLVDDA